MVRSHFKIDIGYAKGDKNVVADALRPWAYPACQDEDSGFHATAEEEAKMALLIEQ